MTVIAVSAQDSAAYNAYRHLCLAPEIDTADFAPDSLSNSVKQARAHALLQVDADEERDARGSPLCRQSADTLDSQGLPMWDPRKNRQVLGSEVL